MIIYYTISVQQSCYLRWRGKIWSTNSCGYRYMKCLRQYKVNKISVSRLNIKLGEVYCAWSNPNNPKKLMKSKLHFFYKTEWGFYTKAIYDITVQLYPIQQFFKDQIFAIIVQSSIILILSTWYTLDNATYKWPWVNGGFLTSNSTASKFWPCN